MYRFVNKKNARIKRALLTRFKLKEIKINRLCVYKSLKHIYAQIVSYDGCFILVSASSVEKQIKKNFSCGGNKYSASIVGKYIAKRAIKNGIKNVAFDRSGFKYHGRIKSLAESAREEGLNF